MQQNHPDDEDEQKIIMIVVSADVNEMQDRMSVVRCNKIIRRNVDRVRIVPRKVRKQCLRGR